MMLLNFLLLWTTYFLCYTLRKPLSIYKVYIESEFHLSPSQLGWIDVALLLPYSLVQIFGAAFWDTFKPNFVILINLSLAAIATLLMALTHEFHLFLALVALSGAAQGPLWPACIKAMPDKNMATHVGLLGTAPYMGASFSASLVSYVADHHGWRHSIIPIAVPCFLASFAVYHFLKVPTHPVEKSKIHREPVKELLYMPGVIQLILSVFLLKFSRYSFHMWLPIYLVQGLSFTMMEAGVGSTAFHIGAALGGPLVGFWVDKTHNKLETISKVILMAAIGCGILTFWGDAINRLAIIFILSVVGFGFCGPDSVINGATTNQLVGEVEGPKLTSLVNGLGTLGGLLEGPIVALIAEHCGWDFVMGALSFISFLSIISLSNIRLLTTNVRPNVNLV